MNVLMICNSYPNRQFPNAYVFVHNQVQMLRKRGHNVIVMDIDLRSPRWKRKYGFWIDNYDGVKVYRMSVPFVTRQPMPAAIVNFLTRRLALKVYRKILKNKEKVDFMHAHFAFASGAAAVAIKKRYGIPYVITEHSSGIHMHDRNIVRASMECYYRADKIITVSEVLKEAIKECGIDREVVVIPNVIDTKRFIPGKARAIVKEFTFLTVARLIPSKGIDILLQAFARMAEKNRNIRLEIVGTGSEQINLEIQVNKLGIKDIVEFKGKIPNSKMAQIYREADCFVLASHHETFGMVYAEAAACGLPLIGTKCGGPEDIICGQNGLLVENKDADALWQAMEQIYINCKNNLYNQAEIHKDIEERFGEQRVYELLMKIYNQL